METTLHKSSVVWNSDLGEFINEQHSHLAQILNDYKPTLSLVYIPKKDRDANDTKPWAIIDKPTKKGVPPHIVRYLSDVEMQNPAEVLAWIFEGDLDRHRPDDVFARLEAKRAAKELLDLKRQEEEMLDFYDKLEFAAKTNLHTWKHDGKVYRS